MLNKSIIILLVSILLVASCKQQTNSEVVSFGPNSQTSLVIFFKKGASNDEINAFKKNILSIEKYNLAIRFLVRNGDYEGVATSFSTDSTSEQREELRKSVKDSPIVYKVYENIAASEIKDL